jgi:SAM-dependent methyltransferase
VRPDFDDAFDALLPDELRAVAAVHWTPTPICLRAAKLLDLNEGDQLLDVGSGVGKFCIAAAAHGPGFFQGVEQRPALVRAARDVATALRVRNVRFLEGDAFDLDWSAYDGLYFFNPFFGARFEDGDGLGALGPTSSTSPEALCLRAADKLRTVKSGARVVTYCELGAPLPDSFSLLSESDGGGGWLRLYVQR